MNTAKIIGGPALVTYRGASFYSQGEIVLNSDKETFEVASDRFGVVDQRVSNENLSVSFTPVGEWESLSVLWPYASTLLGSLLTPASQEVTDLNTTTDVLTAVAHGFADGDDVLVHMATGGTIPTGLSESTRYYVNAATVDTFTLHTSYAEGVSGANPVNVTAAGTGTLYVDRDFPLVIHTFAGVKLTLFNAAVTAMPSISLGATKTLIGPVTFEAFVRNGAELTDAAARWQIEATALTDTSFDPTAIITQPYALAWGASAPWDDFETLDGVEVAFNLSLSPVMTDALGTVTRRLDALGVTATAQPLGITESQLMTKLLLQDTGAYRGRSLSGDDLIISGTGVYVRLYGAALTAAPQSFSSGSERIGQCQWAATRTFTAGVPDDLFYVGTAAPA